RRRPLLLTHHLPKRVVHLLQRPVPLPLAEVVKHRVVIREVRRQHAPLTPRPRYVENGVQHTTQVDLRRAAAPFSHREQRLQDLPLGIRQVRRVASLLAHPLFLMPNSYFWPPTARFSPSAKPRNIVFP